MIRLPRRPSDVNVKSTWVRVRATALLVVGLLVFGLAVFCLAGTFGMPT